MFLEPRVKGSFSPVKDYFQTRKEMTKADELGNRIARARLTLGAERGRFISQAELADMVGLTGATPGNYEAGRTEPSYAILARLAKFLGVDPGWLAFGTQHAPASEDVTNLVTKGQRKRG